ncbi:hypothetical protein STEG23_032548, partial [Scotinomys teguina]
MDTNTDPGCCRAMDPDTTPGSSLGLDVMTLVALQATQINMTPVVACLLDTKMATGGRSDLSHLIPMALLATWVIDVNTDSCCSRTTDADMALGRKKPRPRCHLGPRWQEGHKHQPISVPVDAFKHL